MSFWDSSALFPLIAKEATSIRMLDLQEEVSSIFTWVLTPVEIYSALCRSHKTGRMNEVAFKKSVDDWKVLENGIQKIEDIKSVEMRAYRCLQMHSLKAADALQLAAALVACSDAPHQMGFVTLDARLAEAASKEGFQVMTA